MMFGLGKLWSAVSRLAASLNGLADLADEIKDGARQQIDAAKKDDAAPLPALGHQRINIGGANADGEPVAAGANGTGRGKKS